jgi:hypothetical protein
MLPLSRSPCPSNRWSVVVFRARSGHTAWLFDHRMMLILHPLCALFGVSNTEDKCCGKKRRESVRNDCHMVGVVVLQQLTTAYPQGQQCDTEANTSGGLGPNGRSRSPWPMEGSSVRMAVQQD